MPFLRPSSISLVVGVTPGLGQPHTDGRQPLRRYLSLAVPGMTPPGSSQSTTSANFRGARALTKQHRCSADGGCSASGKAGLVDPITGASDPRSGCSGHLRNAYSVAADRHFQRESINAALLPYVFLFQRNLSRIFFALANNGSQRRIEGFLLPKGAHPGARNRVLGIPLGAGIRSLSARSCGALSPS